MTGRITIGLYNTYDRDRFREAHRRVLARAAPLAMAFDFNLSTFGFPFQEERKTAREIAEFVADSTSIGDGGRYFRELAEKGRFQYFPYPKQGFPPQLGIPVITTSRPSLEEIGIRDMADGIIRGKSFLLVFGLGPHGMTGKEKKLGKYHFDLTGQRISLETCTAIGAVSAAVWKEIEKEKKALKHRKITEQGINRKF